MRIRKPAAVVSSAIVVIAGGWIGVAPVLAQNPVPGSAPVNIVGPLPLPVTGTVDVSGGTVSVSGGTVSVSGTVAVADQSQPINYTFSCGTSAIGCGPAIPYQVPAGQLLIIDQVGLRADGVPVNDAATLEYRTTAGGVAADFWLPPPSLVAGGRSFQGQAVRLTADPETYVFMTALRVSGMGGGATTNYIMSFAGHLVPAP